MSDEGTPIDFSDISGAITLLVIGLKVPASGKYVRSLFERNGFPNLISVVLPSEEQLLKTKGGSWAICVFPTPEQANKALAMRTLISETGATQPYVSGRVTKFSLSTHACETLLNSHFPLRWSSSSDVMITGPVEKRVVRVTSRVFVDLSLVVFESTTTPLEEICNGNDDQEAFQGEIKKLVGLTFHKALLRLRVIPQPSGSVLVALPKQKEHEPTLSSPSTLEVAETPNRIPV